MGHPFRIREIAQQSGLSEATVDRVLHQRPGVRESTIAEVRRAIGELERQRDQVRLGGRTLLVDLVMQAPARFSTAVRGALEAELAHLSPATLSPATLRARFHLREEGTPAELAAVLDRLRTRGSHGVILKAPHDPVVALAVDRLAEAGIPVVTLVTDLPSSRRIGYVGIDNRAAGATAAYLLTRLGSSTGAVLVTLSRSSFRGEEEREAGFRAALREMAPARRIVEVGETDGLDASMLAAAGSALAAEPDIETVYSIGGGNRAILEAFARLGREPVAFVAHDLDGDNTTLLRQGRLTAVLHHDLRADLRQACRLILHDNGATTRRPSATPSQVQIITPHNQPNRLGG
ncbi:DNA-binding protein [metagenome]|uniref:DNA-binding protein n=1 Tax=metagenome TaxID=256318 RepID=A0A2P2BZR9_9ZZZZ